MMLNLTFVDGQTILISHNAIESVLPPGPRERYGARVRTMSGTTYEVRETVQEVWIAWAAA